MPHVALLGNSVFDNAAYKTSNQHMLHNDTSDKSNMNPGV